MHADRNSLSYVLVTPARNEEQFIEGTIQSVVSQTVKPLKWIIVSDGSTDRTDDIVKRYAGYHGWIDLVRRPENEERQFGAKVRAFNTGFAELAGLEYDLIGNLDADISFESGFFEFMLEKFLEDPDLGVAGAPFVEDGFVSYNHNHTNFKHVSGACQIFRKKCFEQVGGYTPIRRGGIDWVAVTTARMMGWKTQTFPEKHYLHHRKIGTATIGPLKAMFRHGQKDFYLGSHPVWHLFRSVYTMKSRPFVIGGGMLMAGYIWDWLRDAERPISDELMKFNRMEQMTRLRSIIGKQRRMHG